MFAFLYCFFVSQAGLSPGQGLFLLVSLQPFVLDPAGRPARVRPRPLPVPGAAALRGGLRLHHHAQPRVLREALQRFKDLRPVEAARRHPHARRWAYCCVRGHEGRCCR